MSEKEAYKAMLVFPEKLQRSTNSGDLAEFLGGMSRRGEDGMNRGVFAAKGPKTGAGGAKPKAAGPRAGTGGKQR